MNSGKKKKIFIGTVVSRLDIQKQFFQSSSLSYGCDIIDDNER